MTESEHLHPVYKPVTEDHYPSPDSVYDVTKVASEVMGLSYARTYGLEFVALRFANIYGPGKLARHGRVSLHSKIIAAVGCLPDAERVVILLSAVEGLGNDEIAVILGITLSVVSDRLIRAIRIIGEHAANWQNDRSL